MDSTRKQTLLYEHFGWTYPEPLYWGRVKVHEFGGFSTSSMRAAIAEGEYSGWDDARLPTLAALRRRGFDSQALRDFWIDLGLTQKDISISMQTIESFNSSIIDSRCERRAFVRDPVSLSLVASGHEIPEMLAVARHPNGAVAGVREWKMNGDILVDATDASGEIRLKDFADITVADGAGIIQSIDRSDKRAIVHWLPSSMARPARLSTPIGDELQVSEGMLENIDLKEKSIVQLERVGFARIETIPEDGPVEMLFLHG
jgi:glutamyl-tRNA synthetase